MQGFPLTAAMFKLCKRASEYACEHVYAPECLNDYVVVCSPSVLHLRAASVPAWAARSRHRCTPRHKNAPRKRLFHSSSSGGLQSIANKCQAAKT